MALTKASNKVVSDDAIDADQIVDDAITTDKVLDAAITSAKINSGVTDLLPTSDEKDALSGTGAPSSSNKYVTNDDSRLALQKLSFAHVESQGTTAGNMTGGTYTERTINTIATNGCFNGITGASLSSNAITLPAGTYDITVEACAQNAGKHRIKLEQQTPSVADIIIGNMCGDADTDTANQPNASINDKRFTIGVESSFKIKSWCSGGNITGDAFGLAADVSGEIEQYLSGSITKRQV